jgi:hypothetical protein
MQSACKEIGRFYARLYGVIISRQRGRGLNEHGTSCKSQEVLLPPRRGTSATSEARVSGGCEMPRRRLLGPLAAIYEHIFSYMSVQLLLGGGGGGLAISAQFLGCRHSTFARFALQSMLAWLR